MPVATVVSTGALSRLIATKPLSPREKAMALPPSSHHLLMSVPATSFRKATIPRMYGPRCSHTRWPTVAPSRHDAHLTPFVSPPASAGGPIQLPPRLAHDRRR